MNLHNIGYCAWDSIQHPNRNSIHDLFWLSDFSLALYSIEEQTMYNMDKV
jgi:hypothetical protein